MGDELSELQEQLERYQSLLEMTGAKGGNVAAPMKPKEDKLGAEIAKLYVLAIGENSSIDTYLSKDAH